MGGRYTLLDVKDALVEEAGGWYDTSLAELLLLLLLFLVLLTLLLFVLLLLLVYLCSDLDVYG